MRHIGNLIGQIVDTGTKRQAVSETIRGTQTNSLITILGTVDFVFGICIVCTPKTIRSILKDVCLATLNLKKIQWTWIDGYDKHEDVPTMLKFLFLEVNPSTVISILKYNTMIEEVKLSVYVTVQILCYRRCRNVIIPF